MSSTRQMVIKKADATKQVRSAGAMRGKKEETEKTSKQSASTAAGEESGKIQVRDRDEGAGDASSKRYGGDVSMPSASARNSAHVPSRAVSSSAAGVVADEDEDDEERAIRERAQKMLHHPIFPPSEKLMRLKLPPKKILDTKDGGADRTRFDQEKQLKRAGMKAPLRERDKYCIENNVSLRHLLGWSTAPDRSSKAMSDLRSQLITDILSRWWYVFPQWPPADYDFTDALRRRGFREVPISEWSTALPVANVNGDELTKVWRRKQFPGIYHDVNGDMVDLRPVWTCPSWLNLQRHTTEELFEFIICALTNQCQVLKQSWEQGVTTKSDHDEVSEELLAKLVSYKSRATKKQNIPALKAEDLPKIYEWL